MKKTSSCSILNKIEEELYIICKENKQWFTVKNNKSNKTYSKWPNNYWNTSTSMNVIIILNFRNGAYILCQT